MSPLEQHLQRFFDWLHEFSTRLSERWREHANRRTILVLLVVGTLAALTYVYVVEPPDTFPIGPLVSIPEGSSLHQTASILQENGVVRSALAFRILVTIMGDQRSVHAGDYQFKEPLDLFSVARAISIGQFGLEPLKIRIPEGATTKEMAIIYGSELQHFDAKNFAAQTASQEGYLFPDTYFFLPNATEDTVLQAMKQNFELHLQQVQPQIASSSHSLAEIVTMASILEKEARTTQDRRMISGVLWNRIAKKIPLQTDVPLIFLTGKPDNKLTMKDLQSNSTYNTYTHKGLPPGPIDSPSMDSILAALNPIKNDYLYYLADRNGVTHYAKTYQQHLQNKARYLGT